MFPLPRTRDRGILAAETGARRSEPVLGCTSPSRAPWLLAALLAVGPGCKERGKEENRPPRPAFSCRAFAARVRTCADTIKKVSVQLLKDRVLAGKDEFAPEQVDRRLKQAEHDGRVVAGVLIFSHSTPVFERHCRENPEPKALARWKRCFPKSGCQAFARCLLERAGRP